MALVLNIVGCLCKLVVTDYYNSSPVLFVC